MLFTRKLLLLFHAVVVLVVHLYVLMPLMEIKVEDLKDFVFFAERRDFLLLLMMMFLFLLVFLESILLSIKVVSIFVIIFMLLNFKSLSEMCLWCLLLKNRIEFGSLGLTRMSNLSCDFGENTFCRYYEDGEDDARDKESIWYWSKGWHLTMKNPSFRIKIEMLVSKTDVKRDVRGEDVSLSCLPLKACARKANSSSFRCFS